MVGQEVTHREKSFEHWYRREHPRLLALLTVVAGDVDMARDATAEAFVRALERWDRVATMDEPAAWTYRVGVNLVRRRARRARLESTLMERAEQPAPPPSMEPELWAAVLQLPLRQRTAIALRYVCDLSQAEVAERMGVAPGTASATLSAARRDLAVKIGGNDPNEVPLA